MWRMTGWLAKTVAAGLIISFLSIWTTGYIVNSYVESLLKQFNIPLDEKPFALSSVWGGLWGADPMLKSDQETAARNNSSGPNTGSAGSDGGDAGKETGTAGSESKSADETPLAVDAYSDRSSGALTDIGGGTGPKGNSSAAPKTNDGDGGASSELEGMSSGSGTDGDGGAGEALRDGVAITTDELSEVKEGMSQSDKEQLFNVMMKKLPQEVWQHISGLMEGGLTNAELTDVQQLIAQHLDKEEYDRMMEIMKKY